VGTFVTWITGSMQGANIVRLLFNEPTPEQHRRSRRRIASLGPLLLRELNSEGWCVSLGRYFDALYISCLTQLARLRSAGIDALSQVSTRSGLGELTFTFLR
jgi:hypothetical protein